MMVDIAEIYHQVMAAYQPACRYLQDCQMDGQSISGQLAVHGCHYLDPACSKTHLYASESVVIYEQMLSVYLADFFVNKRGLMSLEVFLEQVLEQRLFASKIDMRFKGQIENPEFSGRLDSELRSDRRGRYTFVKTLTLDAGRHQIIAHLGVDLRGLDPQLAPQGDPS